MIQTYAVNTSEEWQAEIRSKQEAKKTNKDLEVRKRESVKVKRREESSWFDSII
jgi:hypothetical protein